MTTPGEATTVRPEERGDIAAVRAINERAFEGPTEANLVDKLRSACDDVLSLVAARADRVVGHILFSPITIEADDRAVAGMALGPMAVEPECQRQGIGEALVTTGLAALRERSCPFVIVLGHPEYYPRFGFEPASRYGVACQWEGVPDEAFMILVIDESAMVGVKGLATYRAEFDEAT